MTLKVTIPTNIGDVTVEAESEAEMEVTLRAVERGLFQGFIHKKESSGKAQYKRSYRRYHKAVLNFLQERKGRYFIFEIADETKITFSSVAGALRELLENDSVTRDKFYKDESQTDGRPMYLYEARG